MRKPQASEIETGTQLFAEDEPADYLYQLVGGEVEFEGCASPAPDVILKMLGG